MPGPGADLAGCALTLAWRTLSGVAGAAIVENADRCWVEVDLRLSWDANR